MRSEEVGIGSETSVFLLSLSAYEEVLSGVTGLTLVVSSETSLFSEDTDDCVISDREELSGLVDVFSRDFAGVGAGSAP